MALPSLAGRAPRDCRAESSAWRRLRGEREGGDMVVRAVWKEMLLAALEEGGMGFEVGVCLVEVVDWGFEVLAMVVGELVFM